MPATAVRRQRIPFLVEHPAGAELYGPLLRGQSRQLAGTPIEYPGRCRCCSQPVARSQVNPDYLESLPEAQRTMFVDELCVTSPSGTVFFPRNCSRCDRRGRG